MRNKKCVDVKYVNVKNSVAALAAAEQDNKERIS